MFYQKLMPWLKSWVIGLLALIFHCQLATAQFFPVQVTPQLVPPYSLKLSDYATTTSEKLFVNLLLKDVNESFLQVRLRLSITGRGVNLRSTNFILNAQPIQLTGGGPMRLSNLDLRPYFDLQNLEGITPRQYQTPLPDGLYQFCFEAFDWMTGRPLSDKRCYLAYLVLNDPPFLNMPQRGELIPSRTLQNIIFQWTPRHINATGVSYEFELRELWDTGVDPQTAFLTSPNLYKTTTRATTLHYGPGETSLLEGKTYGWRVRALVSDGISETAVFKNNGYSEIYHFTYTEPCDEPKYLLAKAENTTTEEISWQQNPNHINYKIQYRKAIANNLTKDDLEGLSKKEKRKKKRENREAQRNMPTRVWFEKETTKTTEKISFLEENTTYEYRVGGQCIANGGFSYTQINTFTTPGREEVSDYNCGIPPEIVITNKKPLEQLAVNDVFTASDFPVTVKEVYGGNGTFSGWGFIEVPYLADTRIRVGFNNIEINTDKQLISGIVETDYDPDFATTGGEGIDDIGDELELLGDLANSIIEALNLDITKDTIEKVNQIIDAIMTNIDNEDLPEELQTTIETVAEEIKEAKESYDEAITNEDSEAAQNALDDFNTAQNNLGEAEKEVQKYKKEVADLLKQAILALYRIGRDTEDIMFSEYNQIREELESTTNLNESEFFFIDEDLISEETITKKSTKQLKLYEVEKKIGIYLFAKILSEHDANGEKLQIFIEKLSKNRNNFPGEIQRLKEEGKSRSEIVIYLQKSLGESFTSLLIENIPKI